MWTLRYILCYSLKLLSISVFQTLPILLPSDDKKKNGQQTYCSPLIKNLGMGSQNSNLFTLLTNKNKLKNKNLFRMFLDVIMMNLVKKHKFFYYKIKIFWIHSRWKWVIGIQYRAKSPHIIGWVGWRLNNLPLTVLVSILQWYGMIIFRQLCLDALTYWSHTIIKQ